MRHGRIAALALPLLFPVASTLPCYVGGQWVALRAFVALDARGAIHAWGDPDAGGSGAPNGTGFTAVFSSEYSFAALDAEGGIKTWGDPLRGGRNPPGGLGFTTISSNAYAFAALSVVVKGCGEWNGREWGGGV